MWMASASCCGLPTRLMFSKFYFYALISWWLSPMCIWYLFPMCILFLSQVLTPICVMFLFQELTWSYWHVTFFEAAALQWVVEICIVFKQDIVCIKKPRALYPALKTEKGPLEVFGVDISKVRTLKARINRNISSTFSIFPKAKRAWAQHCAGFHFVFGWSKRRNVNLQGLETETELRMGMWRSCPLDLSAGTELLPCTLPAQCQTSCTGVCLWGGRIQLVSSQNFQRFTTFSTASEDERRNAYPSQLGNVYHWTRYADLELQGLQTTVCS
jgi:hypothetical protein